MPAEMTYVPGGNFIFGPSGAEETRSTNPFYIDVHEATVEEYEACVVAAACTYGATGEEEEYATYMNYGSGKNRHPINYISWQEATDYCVWKGKRLATEEEWEKAARGEVGATYPWGEEDATGAFAVMKEGDGVAGCAVGSTGEVGQKTTGVSSYGAQDMAGNVLEWTDAWLSSEQTQRVLRGGSLFDGPNELKSSSRTSLEPGGRRGNTGVRCVVCTTAASGPGCVP